MTSQEGLLSNVTDSPSVHAGQRMRLSGGVTSLDHEDNDAQNWIRFSADYIDGIGTAGIIEGILKMLGAQEPVYLVWKGEGDLKGDGDVRVCVYDEEQVKDGSLV
ncbi:arginase [Trichoderma gamsii]|uniref:Arginase n=1 Tax=Trichoderma gamsii TaxID=398673 RepID=A0A2P4ZKE2_9HYPO|nr:arginase [Trichoderma gamsii]PON24777.1 arginase [Trichoderma gamsii]